jgi:hypothetical protein
MAVIKENKGAPVSPVEAAKISVADRGRPQTITTVRAATTTSGQVTLAPKSSAAVAAGAAKVVPLEAVRGRQLATASQPVASSIVTTGSGAKGATTSRDVISRSTPIASIPTPVTSGDKSGRGRERTDTSTTTGKTGVTGPSGMTMSQSQPYRSVQQPTPRPTPKPQQYDSRSRNSMTTQSGKSVEEHKVEEHKRVVNPTAPPKPPPTPVRERAYVPPPPKPQNENEHEKTGHEPPQNVQRGRPLTPTPKKS